MRYIKYGLGVLFLFVIFIQYQLFAAAVTDKIHFNLRVNLSGVEVYIDTYRMLDPGSGQGVVEPTDRSPGDETLCFSRCITCAEYVFANENPRCDILLFGDQVLYIKTQPQMQSWIVTARPVQFGCAGPCDRWNTQKGWPILVQFEDLGTYQKTTVSPCQVATVITSGQTIQKRLLLSTSGCDLIKACAGSHCLGIQFEVRLDN